jgi:hypothetical protein
MALALEAHWALYRAALLAVLPTGIWWGVGLAIVGEWARPDMGERTVARLATLRALLVVLSGLTFALTGQLLFCVAAHFIVVQTARAAATRERSSLTQDLRQDKGERDQDRE